MAAIYLANQQAEQASQEALQVPLGAPVVAQTAMVPLPPPLPPQKQQKPPAQSTHLSYNERMRMEREIRAEATRSLREKNALLKEVRRVVMMMMMTG